MKIVDANIVLRYLLNDHTELSPRAKRIIDDTVVEIPIAVLCEVIYVLSGVYTVSRKDICSEISRLFENTSCEISHQQSIFYALSLYAVTNLDFVDCILAGLHKIENATIHTFDKQLQKQITGQTR